MHARLRRPRELASPSNHGHLVFLHQEFEAFDVLGDDRVLALEYGLPVERRRADACQSELGGALQVVRPQR